MFEKEHNDKRRFSTFCQLRSRWCVMAGKSGTHLVCVCTIQQNVKLMLLPISVKIHHKDLLQICVCNISNKEYMIGHCSFSPRTDQLKTFIISSLLERYNDDDSICYMQWENIDCYYLFEHELEFKDSINELIKKLINLMSHHYIAKHWSIFFKSWKDKLKLGEGVLILDFAENNSFMVQDATESFHWNNEHVTLQPFVLYYKDPVSSSLHQHSACISNHMQYDTTAVYAFQR